jgi:hypothetical protein
MVGAHLKAQRTALFNNSITLGFFTEEKEGKKGGGQRSEVRSQRTEVGGRRAEGGRRKTEDGRQKTEDGRRREGTEVRCPRSEVGGHRADAEMPGWVDEWMVG